MRSVAHQCRFLVASAEAVTAGLDDAHRALEPASGIKTAGWLIGHLAVTGDFGRRLCGRPVMCPRDWQRAFNPGSQPSTDASTYPPMATLCATLRSVYVDLSTAAGEMDPAALVAVNPFEPTRKNFATTGEFLQYLMTGHFAYHLGQLVAWRAAAGLPRIERPDLGVP